MRVLLDFDCVTDAELRVIVRAWRQTGADFPKVPTHNEGPIVRLDGVKWGVTLPHVTPEHAAVILTRVEANE